MLKLKSLFLGIALASTMVLVGCNDNDPIENTQNNPAPEEDHDHHENSGRLVFANADQVYTYDLDEEKIISTIKLNHIPNALYTSPQGRYALAVSQTNNITYFIDGGVFGHGDHNHADAPSLLSDFNLTGDKPAHYRNFNGQAALFYDGLEGTSKFELFTDEDIGKKAVLSQSLPSKHHGVAEARGEYVLTSYTPTGWVSGDVANPLKLVRPYHVHGDHFHEEDILSTTCERLHGAASNKNYTAFGCADGILAVNVTGSTFKDEKITVDQRISNLAGHLDVEKFVGIASGTGDLFIIDPVNKNTTSFDWSKGQKDKDGNPIKRLQHAFDHSGKYFFILDNLGQLHTIDTAEWKVIDTQEIIHVHDDDITQSRIVASQSSDHIFINDTAHKAIIEFDPEEKKIVKTISLDNIAPTTFTWVGIAE